MKYTQEQKDQLEALKTTDKKAYKALKEQFKDARKGRVPMKRPDGWKDPRKIDEEDGIRVRDNSTLPKRYLADRKPVIHYQTTGEIDRGIFRSAVRGFYDMMDLRVAQGNRLCKNFSAKLGIVVPTDAETGQMTEDSKEAKKLMEVLMADYKKVTQGVIEHLPKLKDFEASGVISNFVEAQLVYHYLSLVRVEEECKKTLKGMLKGIPIYEKFLKQVPGCGIAMSAVILCEFDPYKARNISSFWQYSGYGVGTDHIAQSKRHEHCVMVEYIPRAKAGEEKTKGPPKTKWRKSITYNEWLRTKLFTLAGCMLRVVADSEYKDIYYNIKNRYESREDLKYETNGHIDMMAKRYMIKQFQANLWLVWRKLEGLETTEPYHIAKLGYRPHGANRRDDGEAVA